MKRFTKTLKIFLWVFITTIFTIDLIKILFDLSLISGSVHQEFLSKFIRSTFGLFELIMLVLIIFFIFKYPKRRIRLIILTFFHLTSVLILPIALKDFTWMAVLYPWPQTLLAFDPKTSLLVIGLSLLVGFIVIPILTFKWGAKGFCGYICPHGAFYSEAYGRLFNPKPGRLKFIKKYVPLIYFISMVVAVLVITLVPSTLDPIRQAQKFTFF